MPTSLALFVDLTNAYNCADDVEIDRPMVKCEDGFTISIQAGYGMHSVPAANNRTYYQSFELKNPSQEDELITKYALDPSDPLNTEYYYIDWMTVERLLDKHGGISNIMWR